MVKLGACYSLCPLINQRSLLGIVEDVIPGHIIVTLGKNIAIKYKLSDQKQILSWRTKDKFTSPVIYNKEEEKYVAVFNQSYIRMWSEDEENIDKQKKYKVKTPIYSLLKCQETIFVIFDNGAIHDLNTVINDRKELNPEQTINVQTEHIGALIYAIVQEEIYIAQLILNNVTDDHYFHLTTFSNGQKRPELHKIVMNRPGHNLIGYCFNKTEERINLELFTLWSDGKLYSYPIIQEDNLEKPLELPGYLNAVIESLSCKHFVTMTALNEHYIAMYGARTNEEGATLNIYNIQFKVTQTRQGFKMFNNGAKLWQFENEILLCVGQNLTVIPFQLDTEQLAALVGSHKLTRNEKDSDISIVQNMQLATWEKNKKGQKEKTNLGLENSIVELLEQGWSVSAICEELIPELIEKKDLNAISESIVTFNCMPESCMVKLLKYLLHENESKFANDNSLVYVIPEELKPYHRCKFIDSVLNLNYTDTYLMQHIRKEFNLTESLLLLKYICYMLQGDSHSLPGDETTSELKLIEWGNILLDANYVKFLLTKDKNVLYILDTFKGLVNEHLEGLEQIRQVLPILESLKKNKYTVNVPIINLPYSIEKLSLY